MSALPTTTLITTISPYATAVTKAASPPGNAEIENVGESMPPANAIANPYSDIFPGSVLTTPPHALDSATMGCIAVAIVFSTMLIIVGVWQWKERRERLKAEKEAREEEGKESEKNVVGERVLRVLD